MAKKKEQSPPEHEELKRILGRIGRRKAQKEQDKGPKKKPPKDQATGDGSPQDELSIIARKCTTSFRQ